jgi:hypothetical protein
MNTLRNLAVLSLLAVPLNAAPLYAQDMSRPDGWQVRFDQAGATESDMDMWVTMPPGWHITTGPAGIFWDPTLDASGSFRAEMEVFLFDPGTRREAFGLFVGGVDLTGSGQTYTYFVIRNGGEFLVKSRRGDDTSTLIDWTAHPDIRTYADRGEDASVKNVLTVIADADEVRFQVNGTQVATLPRSGLAIEGIVGLRVNHALNLHVSRLDVTPQR